ncbi:MAG: TRAP transporter large permease subunit [Deltaproteobacteria bacterium]|nr:TRAP transporter large permease subunit [Deltaproteobacteria bacterium]MDD9854260.1 TRAP transporter large permease subunit [Deltaproteobacteria bacterium]
MSTSIEIALLVLLLGALLVLRQNVFVLLGVAVLYAHWLWGDGRPAYAVYDTWHAGTREILLSLPLFMLAGSIMSRGSTAQRLVKLMRALARPIPGGLALSAIGACAFFAAISGSSTVTLLAVGSIMYPALLADGYSKSFALGLLCAAGTLGIIVPPSIPLILYGVMTGVSIADLFKAGLGPAALLAGLLALYALFAGRGLRRGGRWSAREIASAGRSALAALATPAVVLGGIYSGYFTPTEAAAAAVLTALAVELLVHRELRPRDLPGVALENCRLLGALFPVLGLAMALNTLMIYEQIPTRLVEWVGGAIESQVAFLLGTNALLLLVGCIADVGSAVLVLSPLLQPLAADHAMHPVQFGIMMIVNLEIGYLTPPMGLNLIVAMAAFRESFWTVCRAMPIFVLLMLVGLAAVAWFPPLSLFALE